MSFFTEFHGGSLLIIGFANFEAKTPITLGKVFL